LNQIATSLRSRPVGRHALLVWLTVVALFVQSFVTQTHIHLPSGSLPASARSLTLTGAAVERSAPVGHTSCPLCIELKAAGHYLPPTPFVLIAPAILAVWFHRMMAVAMVPPQPVHHWHSRAPPIRP
jgi:hypothetical protein